MAFVDETLAAATRMIDRLKESGERPWVSAKGAEEVMEGICATLDFMADEDGTILFLEAGPGFGFGAHPCCFYDPEKRIVHDISGVAFSKDSPPVPFQERRKSDRLGSRPA